MKLIDKDAVVAEIERIKKNEGWCQVGKDTADVYYARGFRFACEHIISFLNTLEVKEIDLEKEMDKEWNKCEPIDEGMGLEIASIEHEQFDNIAKHFFELGFKVAQKGEKV